VRVELGGPPDREALVPRRTRQRGDVMSAYHGRHLAPRNVAARAKTWVEFAWAFTRASTQIFAVTLVLNSTGPQFWLHT
jgi:hypothetical protein